MRVVVTEYVSLDGVFEEPGQWSFEWFNEEAMKFKLDELMASDAQLLGRKTYEAFASAWPTMTDEAGFAEKMNSMPKYVASRTLDSDTSNWNGTIIKDVPTEVQKLRAQPGGDLLVAGSADLLRTLIDHNLVDELRLMLYPVVLGQGRRLFEDGLEKRVMRLVGTQPFASGITILTYAPAENPNTGVTDYASFQAAEEAKSYASQEAEKAKAEGGSAST